MTIKQRIVAKEMVENGGTMASALRKAGYSASIVKNPQKVKKSKGFKETLEIMGIGDKTLANVLREGLGATKIVPLYQSSKKSYKTIPDYSTRHRYLETALELKNYIGRNSKPLTENNEVIFINNIPRPSFNKIGVKQPEE